MADFPFVPKVGLTDTELRAASVPVSGSLTVTGGGDASAANQLLGNASLASINTKIPALGQALAAASIPVVLTAAQLTTLTPVSSISVSNFPATQPVSIASMPSTPVTGTFWQATQPVSGTLTANAGTNLNTSLLALDSTVAKDATLGTLNTSVNTLLKPASTLAAITSITNVVHVDDNGGSLTVDGTVAATQSGVWTVQPGNTANTTAWKVDGSAVTQPVSGTFFQATQPISAASLPLPSNASQESGGNLATLVARTPVTGQALAANSSPVILASDQVFPLPTGAATDSTVQLLSGVLGQLLIEMRAMRTALTAIACDGGRNNPEDFDPSTTQFDDRNFN